MKNKFLQFIIVFLFVFTKAYCANEDSLLKVINAKTTSSTEKLKALSKIIYIYKRKDPAKADEYFNNYEGIYKTLKDTTAFTAHYHNLKGFRLSYNGEQQSAVKHYELAEKEFLKEKNYEALWGVYNNFGSAYQNLNNLPKALEYYLKSMEIGEKYLDIGNTAGTAMNIGTIYAEQKMYPEALKYFRLSASVYSKVENSWGYGNDLNNIGQVYSLIPIPDSSEYYYKAAIDVWNKLKDQQGLAMTYHNLGNLYSSSHKFSEAEDYLKRSLDLSYQMKDSYGITVNLSTLSRLAYTNGDKNKGLQYLLESVKYAEEHELVGLLTDNYKDLYKQYKKDGNYKLALEFHERFFALYDSTNSVEKNKQLKEMQEKYESGKKQVEIDQQKLELVDKDLKISEQNRQSMIYMFIIGFAIIIISFVFYQFKQKQKSNKEILLQKNEVERQKEIVDEKQKEILDSITYAKRLQEAILPPTNLLKKHLPEHFILYKPKDIVAGDFYWFEKKGDLLLVAAADCTGHGVPGAMVSVVCSNALHRTVNEFGITEPGKILDKTRELVLETFAKSESEVRDGMDISLIAMNTSNGQIQWSGANNSLWYLQSKEFKEIKAHKQSIGKIDNPSVFPTHEINVKKGDTLYLITDGFADQFGGPKGKKFKYKQLMELILSLNQDSLAQQQEVLNTSFNNWRGDLEQVDDVTIIGIRV